MLMAAMRTVHEHMATEEQGEEAVIGRSPHGDAEGKDGDQSRNANRYQQPHKGVNPRKSFRKRREEIHWSPLEFLRFLCASGETGRKEVVDPYKEGAGQEAIQGALDQTDQDSQQ